MITINGRVRATVRLTANGGDGACVVASSWSSARVFPRTSACGVAFELETAEGELYAVDPFEALIVLPVRRRVVHEDTRTEDAWIADGDALQVEGELQPAAARDRALPILRARRLSATASAGTHRIPPRSLTRGESERIVAPPAPAVVDEVPALPAAESPEPPASAATVDTTVPEQPPRRPKKKRPDSSGTPTPIQ